MDSTGSAQIGDGNVSHSYDEEGTWIETPERLMVCSPGESFEAIMQEIYPNITNCFADPEFIRERAIVTPSNNTVEQLNSYILDKLPGDTRICLSADSVFGDQNGFYPPEFLNIISLPGVPDHKLLLKKGAVVMLMKDIDKMSGLCNGTRLIILQLAPFVVRAKVLTGEHFGKIVLIPRVVFTVNDNNFPFILKRTQFPFKLSYAMTINKIQGQTLKLVGIYLPKPVFTHGQLHVALSSVTSPKGVKLVILDEAGNRTNIAKNVVYKEIFQTICSE